MYYPWRPATSFPANLSSVSLWIPPFTLVTPLAIGLRSQQWQSGLHNTTILHWTDSKAELVIHSLGDVWRALLSSSCHSSGLGHAHFQPSWHCRCSHPDHPGTHLLQSAQPCVKNWTSFQWVKPNSGKADLIDLTIFQSKQITSVPLTLHVSCTVSSTKAVSRTGKATSVKWTMVIKSHPIKRKRYEGVVVKEGGAYSPAHSTLMAQ